MMIYHNMFANGSSDYVSMLPWGIITFLVNELKKKKKNLKNIPTKTLQMTAVSYHIASI